MLFNYYNFSLLVGGLTAVIAGIWVYLENRRRLVNKTWSLFNLAGAVWGFGYFFMINAKSKEVAWISNWILHAAATFLPIFYFHFVLAITKRIENKKYKLLLNFSYLAGLLFVLINPSKLFVQDVVPKYIFNYVCDAGPLYIYFALFFWLSIAFSSWVIFNAILKENGLLARQLKYILLAEVGFIGGGSVFFLTFNIDFPPYPLILYSLYPLIVTYPVVRYRLFSIRLLFSKIYFYLLTSFVLFIFLYLFYVIQRNYLHNPENLIFWIFSFFVTILFSVIFLQLVSCIQRSSDWIFYNGKNPATLIKELSIRISGIKDSNKLTKIVCQELKKILGSKRIEIIFNNDVVEDSFKKELLEAKQALIQNEISDDNLDTKEKLKSNNIEIVMPLKIEKGDSGMIFIDRKENQDVYTKEEIAFVEIIAHQLVTELQKTELSNQIRETRERFSALKWQDRKGDI